MLGLKIDDGYLKVDDFYVFPENHQAMRVFLACSNQWRIISCNKGNSVQGLDLCSVNAVMSAYKVDDTAECLDKVQLIERGVMEIIQDK